jgi:hypothetical protein
VDVLGGLVVLLRADEPAVMVRLLDVGSA